MRETVGTSTARSAALFPMSTPLSAPLPASAVPPPASAGSLRAAALTRTESAATAFAVLEFARDLGEQKCDIAKRHLPYVDVTGTRPVAFGGCRAFVIVHGGLLVQMAVKQRVALCPPNPSELFNTALGLASRATFGT